MIDSNILENSTHDLPEEHFEQEQNNKHLHDSYLNESSDIILDHNLQYPSSAEQLRKNNTIKKLMRCVRR